MRMTFRRAAAAIALLLTVAGCGRGAATGGPAGASGVRDGAKVAANGTPGPTPGETGPTCMAWAAAMAEGAHCGAATPRLALLASNAAAITDWVEAGRTAGQVVFVSGPSTATADRLTDGTWLVNEGQICDGPRTQPNASVLTAHVTCGPDGLAVEGTLAAPPGTNVLLVVRDLERKELGRARAAAGDFVVPVSSGDPVSIGIPNGAERGFNGLHGTHCDDPRGGSSTNGHGPLTDDEFAFAVAAAHAEADKDEAVVTSATATPARAP